MKNSTSAADLAERTGVVVFCDFVLFLVIPPY